MPPRMLRILILIISAPATTSALEPGQSDVALALPDSNPVLRYVSSREVVLSFTLENGVQADFVHLWVSRDRGQNWTPADSESSRPDRTVFQAPDDGRYELFLIANNSAGASSEPPTADAKPHVSIMVDTKLPTLQIHRAEMRSLAGLERKLTIELSVIDENLGDSGVRLFYRSNADSPWRDGGAVTVVDGRVKWIVEDGLPSSLDLRIVATDLAGNWAKDERLGVATTMINPTSRPVVEAPSIPAVEWVELPPLQVAHVSPVEIEHGYTADAGSPPQDEPKTADRASYLPDPAIERLRRLSDRHMAGGQFALAEARLRDALALAPDSTDLLVRRGGALYRLEKFDEAAADFSSALLADRDNIAALEGNALVEATLRRYPEARKLLTHLLELQPRSAKTWVKLGDVEHSLGNAREALAAWERALEMEGVSAEVIRRARDRLDLFRRTRPEPSRRD